MAEKYDLIMTAADMSKDRAKWLELRRTGIGGSDAAVVMNMSSFMAPIELWQSKTQDGYEKEVTKDAEERMHFGNVLEEVVANEFTLRTGKELRKQGMIRSKENQFMIADVDRIVVGENAIVECKTGSGWSSELWEDNQVPVGYYLQSQHYMACGGYDKCYFAVLLGGSEFLIREVARNEEDIKALIEAEKNFWEQYVVTKTPPPADASDAYSHYLSQHTQHLNEESIVMDPMMELKVKDILAIEEQIRMLEEQVALKKNQLRADMINYTSATSERYRVSYKTIERYDIDKKQFMKEYPELYEKLKKRLIYRSLRVSGHNSRPGKKYKD